MTHITLTIEYAKKMIGQTIEWYAFGYKGNLPYAGKAIIKDITTTHIRLEPITGTYQTAFWILDGDCVMGDGYSINIGRAPFTIYNVAYDVPSVKIFRKNGNTMNYGIVVYDGQSVREVIRRKFIFKNENEYTLTNCTEGESVPYEAV